MTQDFDDWLRGYIATAPHAELVQFAAQRESYQRKLARWDAAHELDNNDGDKE